MAESGNVWIYLSWPIHVLAIFFGLFLIDLTIRRTLRKRAGTRAEKSTRKRNDVRLGMTALLLAAIVGTGINTMLEFLAPGAPRSLKTVCSIAGALLISSLPVLLGGRQNGSKWLRGSVTAVALAGVFYVNIHLFASVQSAAQTGANLNYQEILFLLAIMFAAMAVSVISELGLSLELQQKRAFGQLKEALIGGNLISALLLATMISSAIHLVILDALRTQLIFGRSLIIDLLYFRTIIPPLCLILFNFALVIFIRKSLGLTFVEHELSKHEAKILDPSCQGSDVIADVSENIRSQGASMNQLLVQERHMQLFESYADQGQLVLRYVGWAIPTLGFVGTVLGLSQAVGKLSGALASSDGTTQEGGPMSQQLAEALDPMSTAFDTTLVALPLGILVLFGAMLLARRESATMTRIDLAVAPLRVDRHTNDQAHNLSTSQLVSPDDLSGQQMS